MSLQREEEVYSAAIARHKLRAFNHFLEQEPLVYSDLSAAMIASLPGLQA